MANRNRIHVVPKNNEWAVKREGATKASALAPTKEKAYGIAKHLASNSNGEVVMHNKDGKISNPNSFGNDPCPPIDKKH